MPILPRPDFALSSVLEITPAWLAARGLRAVFADLDNTLAGYGDAEPCAAIADWIASLADAGISLAVISNGRPARVRRFCGGMGGVKYVFRAGKPRPGALTDLAGTLGLDAAQILMVGDQIRTDISSGARAGMRTALVYPYTPKFFYRLRRRIECALAGLAINN
ncbi:MAG: HAD-IIIA family hydrolase [Oscillospiraceae bacterium]|nr:HAD-IIIA family hydrolase [Oscillospiraceae bacterium]